MEQGFLQFVEGGELAFTYFAEPLRMAVGFVQSTGDSALFCNRRKHESKALDLLSADVGPAATGLLSEQGPPE